MKRGKTEERRGGRERNEEGEERGMKRGKREE